MISIFAKPAFLNVSPKEPFALRTKPLRKGVGHLMRVSSIIRGDQVAEEIGAKYNPTEGYEDDVCIYVKPMVRKGDDFTFEGRVNYIDIVDGHNLGQLLLKHPEVGVITCSTADYHTMRGVLPNKIVNIPQHHCNFERVRRTRKKIKRVGVIGEAGAFYHLPEGLEVELNNRGMELVKYSRFFTRRDIIDFYMNIDIQIVWRPYRKVLSNPLKIVNASSFGVPTIALDEKAFEEVSGCYLPVFNFEDFLSCLDDLRSNPRLYVAISRDCVDVSENYHIFEIGKRYKQLDQ